MNSLYFILINFPVNWRNQSIYLTRTNTNTGITITAWNNGSHTVDVCIFKQGSTSEVVGPTKQYNQTQ